MLSSLDHKLFDGFGSDLIRNGACYFIACVAPIVLHQLPTDDAAPVIERWWEILNSTLGRAEEVIVQLAAKALALFLTSPVVDFPQEMLEKYLENTKVSKDKHLKRGFSIAIGYLPASILLPHLDVLSDALIEATMIHVSFSIGAHLLLTRSI